MLVRWLVLCALALSGAAAWAESARDFNDAPPEARDQKPAFAGQTRAPVLNDPVALQTTVLARGLVHPWGMAELPDGSWLVTERIGRLRVIGADGRTSRVIEGVPPVDARGQGGLLDVALAPDFAQSRQLWLSFVARSERDQGANATAVVRATLSADRTRLNDVTEIFRQRPDYAGTLHFGGRLVPDGRGGLFVTLGERADPVTRSMAQDAGNHLGKLVRIDGMRGGAPADNPRPQGWLPEIYAMGFRNVQAAALDGQGRLWTVEHGPRGGDEVNRPQPGRNYGWPTVSYGIDYSGQPIGQGLTARPGTEQPVYYWDPVVAPSGMAFYDGAMFPDWRGSALIGGLKGQALIRLTFNGDRVTGEARYLRGTGRIRDVAVAQDGAVMLLTDAENGALIRVTPAR